MFRALTCLALLAPAAAFAGDRPLAIPADGSPPTSPPQPYEVQRAEPTTVYRPYTERPPKARPAPEQPALAKLHRANTWAAGLRMGSLHGGYTDGLIYGDGGFGGTVRYRPIGPLAIQADLSRHRRNVGDHGLRKQTLTAVSMGLFAFHRQPVSPYALAGMTWTTRSIEHNIGTFSDPEWVLADLPLSGTHLAAGLEVALGPAFAIDLEARHIQYLSRPPGDQTRPGALTTTVSLLLHF